MSIQTVSLAKATDSTRAWPHPHMHGYAALASLTPGVRAGIRANCIDTLVEAHSASSNGRHALGSRSLAAPVTVDELIGAHVSDPNYYTSWPTSHRAPNGRAVAFREALAAGRISA